MRPAQRPETTDLPGCGQHRRLHNLTTSRQGKLLELYTTQKEANPIVLEQYYNPQQSLFSVQFA